MILKINLFIGLTTEEKELEENCWKKKEEEKKRRSFLISVNEVDVFCDL